MPRGEVLVAIVNNLEDMRLASEAGWYRIPVASVRKWLRDCWPPRWLAFYQTKVFGPEAPEPAQVDRQRDNALGSRGWQVLRFNTTEIHERPVDYCVSEVMKTINYLGGPDHTTGVPVQYDPSDPLSPQQLGLFDQET